MRLLLDEMWPSKIAEQLRRRGHEVEAVKERPELIGKPDTVIFAVAQAERRAVVTENADDFRPLAALHLQSGHSHHGLVLTSDKSFPRHHPRTIGRLSKALHELLTSHPGVRDLMNRERWPSP